jgi:hypothetical protein
MIFVQGFRDKVVLLRDEEPEEAPKLQGQAATREIDSIGILLPSSEAKL